MKSISELPFLPCWDNCIVLPEQIQKVFRLPKYIIKVVEETITGDQYVLKTFASDQRAKPKDFSLFSLDSKQAVSAGYFQIPEDLPYFMESPDIQRGVLPTSTCIPKKTFMEGIYCGNKSLVLVNGNYHGAQNYAHGVAICSTLEYIQLLQQYSKLPDWRVESFSELEQFIQALHKHQGAKLVEPSNSTLESEIELT